MAGTSHGHPIPSSEAPFPLGGAFDGVVDTSDWLPGKGWTNAVAPMNCPPTNADIVHQRICELIDNGNYADYADNYGDHADKIK